MLVGYQYTGGPYPIARGYGSAFTMDTTSPRKLLAFGSSDSGISRGRQAGSDDAGNGASRSNQHSLRVPIAGRALDKALTPITPAVQFLSTNRFPISNAFW